MNAKLTLYSILRAIHPTFTNTHAHTHAYSQIYRQYTNHIVRGDARVCMCPNVPYNWQMCGVCVPRSQYCNFMLMLFIVLESLNAHSVWHGKRGEEHFPYGMDETEQTHSLKWSHLKQTDMGKFGGEIIFKRVRFGDWKAVVYSS